MFIYSIHRLLLIIPTLIGVTLLTFVVSNILPMDPARLQVGPRASEETLQRVREELGLNDSLPIQYGRYLYRLCKGDLGTSIFTGRDITSDLGIYFPATVELALFAFVIAVLFGVGLGTLAAIKSGQLLDHLSRITALLGVAVPVFWLGIMLQIVFFSNLRVLPASGRIGQLIAAPKHVTGLYVLDTVVTGNWLALKSSLLHLVLPSITLSFGTLALISRAVRASVLEVLEMEYVNTARAKGLAERIVIARHVLRNALLPIMTMSGLQLALLMGGAILTETVFTWPGVGRYIVQGCFHADFPAIMGSVVVIGAVILLINFAVDLSYMIFDPRIKYD